MKKPKKLHYIQEWGTYSNQTFVAVGYNLEELAQVMKDCGVNPVDVLQFLKESKPHFDAQGFVWHSGRGGTVLWFPDWKNDWFHWDTLLHETNHLVFDVFSRNGMMDEAEAVAYQHEFLFRNIRRQLWALSTGREWIGGKLVVTPQPAVTPAQHTEVK